MSSILFGDTMVPNSGTREKKMETTIVQGLGV